MDKNNPKRSGWIYVGAAVAVCLVALAVWRAIEQTAAPDPFTVKLEDLLDETPGISSMPENEVPLPALEAFCSSLDDAGVAYKALDRNDTTAVFKLTGEDAFEGDRLVCSLNGAGQVTAFTLELLVFEKPPELPKNYIEEEENIYALRLERYESFQTNMSFTLNACFEAFGADKSLSYATLDRMEAEAETAVADKKADTFKKGVFEFSVLFRDVDGRTVVHLSLEKTA